MSNLVGKDLIGKDSKAGEVSHVERFFLSNFTSRFIPCRDEIRKSQYGAIMIMEDTFQKSSDRYVAVKCSKICLNGSRTDDAIQEISVLAANQGHPNVVKLLGWWRDDEHYYTVMEYLPQGELVHFLNQIHERGLGRDDDHVQRVRPVLLQIALGLAHLHSKNYAMMDLHMSNIMLNGDTPKLIDLGASIYCPTPLDLSAKRFSVYTGPELLPWMDKTKVNPKASDIWCFGLVLLQVLCFVAIEPKDIPTNIIADRAPEFYRKYGGPKDLEHLVLSMLNPDPRRRPTIDDVLNHPYFRQR